MLSLVYFAALAGALVRVLSRRRSTLYTVMGVLSLFITWYFIFEFFTKESIRFGCEGIWLFTCKTPSFLSSPSVFVVAYENVVRNPIGWMMSSQLLTLTLSISLLLHSSQLSRFDKLAYFCVGFLGAMSAMSFLLINENLKPRKPLSPITSIVALFCIAGLPISIDWSYTAFVGFLAILHLILVIPPNLFPCHLLPHRLFSMVSIFSLVIHVCNVIFAISQPHSNPFNSCQISISLDVVLSTTALCIILRPSAMQCLMIITTSPGAVIPFGLAHRP